jgi:heme A synthase
MLTQIATRANRRDQRLLCHWLPASFLAVRTLKIVAPAATLATYALIVLGFIVRITGSGMGCGDDWPLCNGKLIPDLSDRSTLLEWSHRLAALAVSAGVFAVVAAAFAVRPHRNPSPSAVDLRKISLLAATLLLIQVLLGAVTVWLELPPTSVVLHLATALALLATLLVANFRAWSVPPGQLKRLKPRLLANGAVALGALTLLFGGLTANLDASVACRGFPLCNGAFWPSGSALATIHWIHRLAAYAFAPLVVVLAYQASRLNLPFRTRAAVWTAVTATGLQIAVAAAMVTGPFSLWWRSLHAAIGTGVWVALVWLAWEAGILRPRQDSAARPTA